MEKESIKNNKRIAKNTLLLYFRTLCTMFIGFFTTRVTLDALGVVDYGIHNVTAGVVSIFNVISGSMSVATSRFITIWVGRGDKRQLNAVFSTSIIIQAIIAIVICLIIEIIGIWFLNNKIVLPIERLYAAHWVLHCSTISFMLGLICVPYNAVIIAHERMSAFAYLSIFRATSQLIIVYLIYISPFDKLIFYSILMTFLSFIMRLIYGTYCHKHFEESHFKIVFDRQLLNKMFSFIGWAFLGNAAWTIKGQGTNILLNLFCGPTVNAARGIASHVNGAIYSFILNFFTAVNPQITKQFSSGDLTNMHALVIRSSKFAFFIMVIFLIPISANIDYILNLWLNEVPEHTASFVILILLYSLLQCFYQPLLTGVLAQGDIKYYEIALTLIYFLYIIASYIILNKGFEPEWCFAFNNLAELIVIIVLLIHSKIKYHLSIRQYFKKNIFRTIPILLASILFIYLFPVTHAQTFNQFTLNTLASVMFICTCVIVAGLTRKERYYLRVILKNKISYYVSNRQH